MPVAMANTTGKWRSGCQQIVRGITSQNTVRRCRDKSQGKDYSQKKHIQVIELPFASRSRSVIFLKAGKFICMIPSMNIPMTRSKGPSYPFYHIAEKLRKF